MAVPGDPTVTSIVTQALKRAGRTTPTSTQIQEAIDHALQEVKADIMLIAPTHPNLIATSTTVTTRGQQRYAVPEDWNEQKGISLLDGPDDWRGTVQSGSTLTVQLASSFSPGTDEVVGKYVLITSGSGVEEYRQILEYDSGSKIATVDLAWTVDPVAGSTYLIVREQMKLWPHDVDTDFDMVQTPTVLAAPRVAAINGQEFLLYPVPDKSTYGLLNRYYVDLSKLDESESLFVQLLREWRSTWIQGVAVKSMQRFDEDRYQSELGVYKLMLDTLASQTCTVRQVRYQDY